MSADPRLNDGEGPSWQIYLADRTDLIARLDRIEAKLDASLERKAEWSVRTLLVVGAAACATFFQSLIGP